MTELRMRIWRGDSGQRGFSFGWDTDETTRDTIRKEMLALAEGAIDHELEEIFGEKEGK